MMEELAPTTLAKPLDKNLMSNDSAMLRSLTGMLNDPNITGAELPASERKPVNTAPIPPGGLDPRATPAAIDSLNIPTPTPQAAQPTPQASPANPTAAASTPPVPLPNRLVFTGRGVREAAAALGAKYYTVNGPVLALANYFYPGISKDTAGAETFLAAVKAWGANEISKEYPVTPARAMFVTMVRAIAPALPAGISWANFGANEGFWIDACVASATLEPEDTRVVVSGLTTDIELKFFSTQGFQHWHLMARPGHKVTIDSQNKLNSSLDNSVTTQVSQQRTGGKLRAIWNDNVSPISNRLWTLPEFLARAGVSASPVGAHNTMLME